MDLAEIHFEILKVALCEIELVQLAVPIWRIQVKECPGPIVAFENFLVWQALDLYPLQSLVGFFKELWKAAYVETRRPDDVIVVRRAADQPRKGVFLQIKESCCTLDVCQRFRVLRLEQRKPLSAHKAESQIAQQFSMMGLTNPEEISDLAVQVIEHLHGRWFFVKEHLRSAGKRLGIRRVLRERLNDLFGESLLSSDVGKGTCHENGGLRRRTF